MKRHALSIDHLSFRFDRHQPYFFENVSLALEENKIHFIQGKNGSGKSTLFRILRGTINKEECLSGTFKLFEQEFILRENEEPSKDLTNKIKMVQQKFDLMIADQFTFTENLRLANLPEYPTMAPLPTYKPLPELIKRFAINFEKPAYLLSGGQRQILAILMALQKPATLLLLDEPTAALDEKNAEMVMDFLQQLIQSVAITIVIICHDRKLVEDYVEDFFFEIHVNDELQKRDIIKKTLKKNV